MIHNSEVLKKVIAAAEKVTNKESKPEVYIIQNIYGKIIVYVSNATKEYVTKLKQELTQEIGQWLNTCESYEDIFFAKEEIQKWKTELAPVRERIWVFEKYITNFYWDANHRKYERCELNSNLVSFYSFKGGVGRTTALLMSAIGIAKRGKKVAILDFDLEAPGISSLFSEEALSPYGILDFLVECNIYPETLNIDEYLYPVSEYCHVSQYGGEIYVMPAVGKRAKDDVDLYRKSLMRFDMDTPIYGEKKTPVDRLLSKIDSFLKPDYIFIDTRSGIHQIGGITLTRYSDLALMFFYGSRQNIEGMRMTLPVLKSSGTPFLLINNKVPVNETLADTEKKIYMEGIREALGFYEDDDFDHEMLFEDESPESHPISITYNAGLEVVQSVGQLLKCYEEQEIEYNKVVNAIEDALQSDIVYQTILEDKYQPAAIATAFSKIMGNLETAAAEDEFKTEIGLQSNFYPLKSYTFIFDQRKFLVLGQKGVGKTALFTALKHNRYAKALAKFLNVSVEQYEHTEWIVGTSQAMNYIDIFECLESEEQIRGFLYYETLRILLENDNALDSIICDSTGILSFREMLTPGQCRLLSGDTTYFLKELLDAVNKRYKECNRVVTIIYDALDRIVTLKNRAAFVSALIEIWYMNENSLQNIRSKIFLRKDIYDKEVNVPDKVKLKNYSTSIIWEYDQLFAMIWKRVISLSDQVKDLYEKTLLKQIREVPELGYIPSVNEEENRKMLSTIIGVKMGSEKKASTYNWFRNRLADTQGSIVPRSLIDIFAKAADRELALQKEGKLSSTKSIIRPRCFEDMLPEISEKRTIDLKEEFLEYTVFFENLKNAVQRSPVEEDTLLNVLRQSGFTNPQEEIKKLIDIGILRKYQRRLSEPMRYHFPDIYLRGLGLQRLGMR